MDTLIQVWANTTARKILLSLIFVLLGVGLKRLLLRLIRVDRAENKASLFTVRKFVGYTVDFLVLAVVFLIWAQPIIADISVTLGILGAGLAFALQELIGALAGWLTIVTTQPFNIGDRIEINGVQGDVVDITPLFTRLLEIRHWLNYDHPTGRLVSVSNAAVFQNPVFNYSQRFNFIWDQIVIPITYDSDWQAAIQILLAAVRKHPDYTSLLPKARAALRKARQDFAIRELTLEPQVFVKLTDNWVELTLLYPVEATARPWMHSDLSKTILQNLQEAGITVASETIDIVHFAGPASQSR